MLDICLRHISINLPNNHLETNNLLISLLYNDVKNLSSILNWYICQKCVSSKNITKALSLYDDQFSIIVITRPENHLRTNKQLINLLYNDVKNLFELQHSSKVCVFQE